MNWNCTNESLIRRFLYHSTRDNPLIVSHEIVEGKSAEGRKYLDISVTIQLQRESTSIGVTKCAYVYCFDTSVSPFIIWYAESVGHIQLKRKNDEIEKEKEKKKKTRLHPILQRGAVIDHEIGWCAQDRGEKLLPSLQIRDMRDMHLCWELLTVIEYARSQSSIVIKSLTCYFFTLVTRISINICISRNFIC